MRRPRKLGRRIEIDLGVPIPPEPFVYTDFKLWPDEVRELQLLHHYGLTPGELAKLFPQVSRQRIHQIVTKKDFKP
jgi:hypothetical protein